MLTENRVYRLVSLLILLLGVVGFVRQTQVAGLPPDFPRSEVRWPATADRIPVADEDQLIFILEGYAPGDTLSLVSPAGRIEIIASAANSFSYLLIAAASGLFFWLVAFVFFVPRLAIPAVPQFFWITNLYGLGILIGGVFFQPGLALPGMILNGVQLTSLALLPVVFLHMTLLFPRPLAVPAVTRGVLPTLYVLAAVLVVWQSINFGRYFQNPTLATARGLEFPQQIADWAMVAQATFALLVMTNRASRLEPGRERQQARWLLVGFIVGATPYLFFRTVPQLFSVAPPFPAHFDRLFEPAIPLAFLFAVARYRFLDIDIILRRGLLYGILAGGMAGLILLPTALMSPDRIGTWPFPLQNLPVLFGVLAGILFLPLRHGLGRWIDRAFFRIEHRLDQILIRLGKDLKTVSGQEQLAELVRQQIGEAVKPEICRVETDLEGAIDPQGPALLVGAEKSTCPEIETDHFPESLIQQNIVIALRLGQPEQTLGWVLLGPRKIGHCYVRSELAFLGGVAEVAAARLQEIRMVQEVSEEKIKRAQLDELNRLKDDFLSQVSHDLRTPVTSVGWSVRNLLDGLAGELTVRQKQYLVSMEGALEHLNHLVSSLLEISRLESGKAEIPVEVCALATVLDRALGTISPLAEASRVEICQAGSDTGLELTTNPNKLTEVLVNILENCVRYSPVGQTLELMASAQDNRVRLVIRDHGPGFQDITDPFSRFAQGKPSPHSPDGGYGLGLAIAKEYTVLMGGEITADNHPGGGARFTLNLPGPNQAKVES